MPLRKIKGENVGSENAQSLEGWKEEGEEKKVTFWGGTRLEGTSASAKANPPFRPKGFLRLTP